MATAVLVRGGGRLFLVDPDAGRAEPCAEAPGFGPIELGPRELASLRAALAGARRSGPVRASDPELAAALRGSSNEVELATLGEFRSAHAALPWPSFRSERGAWLEWARARFARALASPEETLIALAREEERLERVRAREQGAFEHWISPDTGPLAEHREVWQGFRTALAAHHEALIARVEAEAARTVPNLAAIVGPRTAARLVAAAGGLSPLARISASRLQLLGARRRTGGNRGPKYGVLARSVLDPSVPPLARGAYARSLAAMAAIAVRADATTRAPVAPRLLARRARRLAELRARYPT